MRVILLSLLLLLQDDASERARRLVERLASEKLEERDDATLKLRAMGQSALPELEKASAHPDPEVASRVRGLLRRLGILKDLSDRLLRVIPEAESRLISGDAHEWTAVFLEAAGFSEGTPVHPELTAEDLEGLGGPAIRAAKEVGEKRNVCLLVRRWRLPASARDLTRYLSASDGYLRGMAALTLGELGVREAAPAIVPLLRDPDDQVRCNALRGLSRIAETQAAPSIRPCLRDADERCRGWAAAVLAGLGDQESAGEIRRLLEDKSESVCRSSALALVKLGAEPPGPALIRLLGPEHPREVRAGATSMLGQLGIREGLPLIGKLLEARDLTVRNAAASALGDLGDREARQTLEGLLDDGAMSTRLRAVRSLAKLRLPEVIPALRLRLADEYREIRLTAAEGLCHLGSSEGVPILLQDRNYLAFLNALRQPRLWQQLSSRRINIDGGALKSEYLEILEKEAGLPFEGAKELTAREEGCILWSARLDPIRQDPSWRRITVLEGVEMLASPNYAFVLEADRIRLLPPAEALKFWTDWWEQEGKKK